MEYEEETPEDVREEMAYLRKENHLVGVEVDRLHATLGALQEAHYQLRQAHEAVTASLRQIAQAVAEWGDEHSERWLSPNDCPHCNLPARDEKDWPIVEHEPNCPITKARILASYLPTPEETER